MSELREMHLSELLTILAEVPGDRLDHFNNAIRMAKNCEAERSALLREVEVLNKKLDIITRHRPPMMAKDEYRRGYADCLLDMSAIVSREITAEP